MIEVQVSPRHKLVGVPFAPEVRNLWPQAREMSFKGSPHILLPHGPVETFMLRRLGFDVPAPILSQYEWSGLVQPFDVQKKTCALLTVNDRAYVLNGMGTGKTKAMLWAWDYLRGNDMAGRLLVLAPLSTLEFTWKREVLATIPHRKAVVLHGTKAQRLAKLCDKDAEIFIINHDGIKVIFDDLMNRPDIDALGIDELAVFRNGQADRSKLAAKLAAKMKWAWGMTGGPIPNSPTDAWSQARIITPGNVPKFFGRFRDELMLKVSQFKYIPKPDAAERAFSVLQPAVRYSLDDVTELPECVMPDLIEVPMGTEQARVYKGLAKACYAKTLNGEITAANAGAAMMKLLQIATGWVYRADRSVEHLDNDLRIERLLNDIEGSERKVLVFVPFKHALAGISAALTKEKIEHAVVSGDTPAGERATTFNLFQNSTKYKCLVAHPQCLAHGITLTSADTIIWFGPVSSLETYDQANARIRRVGQQHKQLVLRYAGTPVEKKIYGMLADHQKVQDQLLTLFEDASE